MPGEVQLSYVTAKTAYFQVRNRTSGFIWNVSGPGAFEAYATAKIDEYDTAMSEQGTASAYYAGTFPAAIGAGVYDVIAKERIGGTVAETDPTIGTGEVNWTGSGGIVRPLSDLVTSGIAGLSLPVRITRGQSLTNFPFKIVSSVDHITAITSGLISGQISRDGGSFGSLQSGAASGGAGYAEMGLGWYRLSALTSGDMNALTIALRFQAAGSDPRDIAIITQRLSG